MGVFEHVKGGWNSLKGYWFKNIIIAFFYAALFSTMLLIYYGFSFIGNGAAFAPLIFQLFVTFVQECGRVNASVIMNKKNQLVFKDYFPFLKNGDKFKQYFFTWLLVEGLVLLWSLLIVMGVIKSLAYRMSLYLVSQKEMMGPFEVINRSSKMMQGRKCELFKMTLVFRILQIIELIMEVVFINMNNDDDNDGRLIFFLVLVLYMVILKLFVTPLYFNSVGSFYLSIKDEDQVAIQVNVQTVKNNTQLKENFQMK